MACVAAAMAAVLSIGRGRWWPLSGLATLAGGWIFGTATALLSPAVAGSALLFLSGGAGGWWRRAAVGLAVGGALVSAALCWIFPLPVAPPLPGPHAVGVLDFELAAEGDGPPLVARVWYPAQEDPAVPFSSWLPDPELGPKFPFHRMRKALGRSKAGLEVAGAGPRLPVIFYEHSWTGHRAENVAQVEALASHGFVIVAVDHPGQAARVRYGDGSIIAGELAGPDLTTDAGVADFEAIAERCLGERTEQIVRITRALAGGAVPVLKNRLDLERMGVFGFSFGGTCALRLCATDPHFHAGSNEDGLFLGEDMPRGPFLFFDEEMPDWLLQDAGPEEGPGAKQVRRSEGKILAVMKGTNRIRVIIDGTGHDAFSDRIHTCRIPRLARTGTRSAQEVHGIITGRLAAFFKRQLGAGQ